MHDTISIRKYLFDYFAAGAKQTGDFRIGVELEHFILDKNTNKNVDYYSDFGARHILKLLKPSFPVSFVEDEKLLGVANDDYSITLEPGSQIEISINPQDNIKKIEEIYYSFIDTIKDILHENELILATNGYMPVSSVYEMFLLPKKRYAYMDRHFSKTGTMGINMMRGTASCQVSIDYQNEADFIRKIRYAYLLSPVFSYMTSNSPVFEGEENSNPLIRTLIWRNTDKLRTGIIPGLFNIDFGFEKYIDYVLNAPAIFRASSGGYVETKLTALEILRESVSLVEPAELYISLMFPDVRLKQYIEIRVADSMPIDKVLGYTAFIKGIFHNLGEIEHLFKREHFNDNSIIVAQDNLMRNNPFVYGTNINALIDNLAKISMNCLNEDEQIYLQRLMNKG